MQLKRLVVILAIVPGALLAQDTADVKLAGDHPPDAVLPVTAGVTTGSMTFGDHRVQQGVTGVVRWHMAKWASVAASPTYARMTYPASLGGGAAGGLTDLPIEMGLDHSFNGEWSPAVGLSLGATIPVGDKQIGLGSGSMGASVGAGVGLSPLDELSLHLGAGKSLTDYSMFGALGASDAVWGEAEASYHLLEHLDATIGFDGDFAASDTVGAARAIALSFAAGLGGPYTLTVSGGHGVSGPAARWTFALGFGTDFAGFQAIGSSSPIQRLMRSMGGSSHRGSGSGSSGSGHGRAP
ncbi:MAG TPA: hypothetical protein VJW73_12480 [Gemmatimonadaceae bacterium]|nr:hypothetical protein [Gemmatimonadaceae bacterium]